MPSHPFPKIELHVHLEATVPPARLVEMAARNGVPLPAEDPDELARLFVYRDFAHFLELWMGTTPAICAEADFRQIVVDYAEVARAQGAVYLEAIFTPVERTTGGATWDEVFSGFCDGAAEATERTGVEVRLTPDIPRNRGLGAAMTTVRFAAKYRERGVVAVGLGGPEADFPPELFGPAFRLAAEEGLGSVPHAGEAAGPASVRGALDVLGADRLRHGIRAVEDPGLLAELSDRGIVCDVCPVSNLRTGVVTEMSRHPLPALLAAGVPCTVNTDDPVLFDTDLNREHEVAAALGHSAEAAYFAGVQGALCDDTLRRRLAELGRATDWAEAADGARP
jgi:aminodeoxyfutalosine deaminase